MKAELLIDSKCILAEGIQWRADQQRLWWTDIHGRGLWHSNADGNDAVRIETPERLGSFAFDPDGHILAAFETGLFRWDLEGDRLERLTEFEPDKPTTRMNDGRCDRQGRFLAGGMNEDELKPVSSLMRYDGNRVETVRRNIGCSNSLCFSPDGSAMYFTDTPTRTILRMPYDAETGEVGPEEPIVSIENEEEGFPDGTCVDADGALWNGRFNGFRVQQTHADGSPGLRIDLPVPQVTCACFGGPDLDRLYITTAREHMTDAQIAEHPLSGGIFVAEPGAKGLPEDRFAHRLFSD